MVAMVEFNKPAINTKSAYEQEQAKHVPNGDVVAKLSFLSSVVGDVETRIGILASRLEPVVKSNLVDESPIENSEPTCPLSKNLCEQYARLRRIDRLIVCLLDNLEI